MPSHTSGPSSLWPLLPSYLEDTNVLQGYWRVLLDLACLKTTRTKAGGVERCRWRTRSQRAYSGGGQEGKEGVVTSRENPITWGSSVCIPVYLVASPLLPSPSLRPHRTTLLSKYAKPCILLSSICCSFRMEPPPPSQPCSIASIKPSKPRLSLIFSEDFLLLSSSGRCAVLYISQFQPSLHYVVVLY